MRRAFCLGLPLVLFLACSSKTEPQGQLMLSMQTDLSLPKDVNAVRIEVSTFGRVNFAQDYEVGPNGAKIPATLGIVAGSNKAAPVRVRIIAKLNGQARLLREAVTTVPATRLASLRLPLQYLSLGQVVSTGSGTVNNGTVMPSSVRTANLGTLDTSSTAIEGAEEWASSCGEGKSADNGECVDITIDSETLPDYKESDVFGGGDQSGNGTCFDTYECLAEGQDAQVDLAACAFPFVQGTTNVGLRVPGGAANPGICGDDPNADCYVPLDAESAWKVDGANVLLPKAVCTKLQAGAIRSVVYGSTCEAKTASIPTCGPWSGVNGKKSSPDGGTKNQRDGGSLLEGGLDLDATLPIDANIDAAPINEIYQISGGEKAITSLAINSIGTTIYFASTEGKVRQTAATAITPADTQVAPPPVTGAPFAMRLAYGSTVQVVNDQTVPLSGLVVSDGTGTMKGYLGGGAGQQFSQTFTQITALSSYAGGAYFANFSVTASMTNIYRTIPTQAATSPNSIVDGFKGIVNNLVGSAGDHFHFTVDANQVKTCLVNGSGGACSTYRPTVAGAAIHSLAADDAYVYFWEGNSLTRMEQVGDHALVVLNDKDTYTATFPTALTSLGFDAQIAVDANAFTGTHYLYYSTANAIRRVPVLGGPAEDVATGQAQPIALLVTATDVYWSTIDGMGNSLLFRREKKTIKSTP